jgi:hypothetical protein
MMLPVVE